VKGFRLRVALSMEFTPCNLLLTDVQMRCQIGEDQADSNSPVIGNAGQRFSPVTLDPVRHSSIQSSSSIPTENSMAKLAPSLAQIHSPILNQHYRIISLPLVVNFIPCQNASNIVVD
jgi:hypothetical protein